MPYLTVFSHSPSGPCEHLGIVVTSFCLFSRVLLVTQAGLILVSSTTDLFASPLHFMSFYWFPLGGSKNKTFLCYCLFSFYSLQIKKKDNSNALPFCFLTALGELVMKECVFTSHGTSLMGNRGLYAQGETKELFSHTGTVDVPVS